ncbi:MAG: NDP-sugar synthase [Muribaculaceae bacterium]|nr:NDP-sugar synthase [Muribaculaceae bacterium]MDE6631695.1 NDP-sugar synthase [Muribaculaceae bacterium]
MDYVILAGGLGSRFVKEGYEVPKPMVPLFGEPMIGVLINTLMKCGAEHIYVGANARMQMLLDYLEELKDGGLPVVTRPIITDNSYCTLKAASEGIEGKFVAMTCDAIFPIDEFKEYVKGVAATPDDVALMGLTRFIEDESPLYARVNKDGEVIDYRYGGEPFEEGAIVSAGLYGLSGKIMDVIPDLDLKPESLSDFQRLLAAETPVKVLPFEFSVAFDVDNTRDRLHAESFLGKM